MIKPDNKEVLAFKSNAIRDLLEQEKKDYLFITEALQKDKEFLETLSLELDHQSILDYRKEYRENKKLLLTVAERIEKYEAILAKN